MGTYETFRNVKAHLNYRSIELFDRIYRYGWADESSVGAFVRNIDHYRKLLAMVSEQGPFAEKFIHECQKNLCIDNPVIGITPLYSGKHGGSYLVVAQRGAVRDAVEYATMRISESFPGAEILYRSAKDGTCSGGIEILKDYRETASGEATRVVYVDTAGKKRFCGYIEALSDTSENLIFDAIGRKIYFR
ncbi:MAG: hypothetical protein QG650_740 [Patescibacteria group bacterium]|nr:hypothetical protein [Patescibacteria group bacterium]